MSKGFMARGRCRAFGAIALVVLMAGCGRSAPPPAPAAAPATPPVNNQAAEVVKLPDIPTQWTNDKPIGSGAPGVTDAQLLAGTADPKQWLLYGGDYTNQRFSPLKQLSPATVPNLQVAWIFPTGTFGQFEVSPVVYDGIMYVTSSYNRIFALNAATGELYWRYDRKLPEDTRLCCGPVNRGVGIKGDTVMMATLDAHLIAFDRLSGKIKWDVEIANYKDGYSATSAPFVLGNNAIIGVAGGEYGVKGFFDAYDIETGKRVWRHYTMPQKPGDPGADSWAGTSYEAGGTPAWTQGAYDKDTNTLYWTTGNPGPDWNGDDRAGDNLFADSVMAVDPATGDMKWYFQFTPHDVWDYDGNTQIFLVDINFKGKPVKALVQADRNGYYYILDRTTGQFLQATQYVEQLNWATIDDKGRPIVNPKAMPDEEPDTRVCPGNMGGMNGAWTGALNPNLKTLFIPAIEACQQFIKGIPIRSKGNPYMAGLPETTDVTAQKAYGNLNAIDVATGEIRWRYRDKDPMAGGVLATAGGVVITGTGDGHAIALDATNGKVLWEFKVGGGVRSQPVAYQVGNDTFVALGAGNWATITAFQGGTVNIPEGGTLVAFKLPSK